MAATIQTIQKPTKARALDTSGNNNHGQIYSGRALEFDGVTDYIVHNNGTGITGITKFADNIPWTCAVWINKKGAGDTYFVGENGGTQPHFRFDSAERLVFRSNDNAKHYYFLDSDDADVNNRIQLNTWYRLVMVCDGTNITAYLNGQFFGKITAGQDSSAGDTPFDHTEAGFWNWGAPYSSGGVRSSMFEGMMSDAQVWDVAWTAADALYDYNNPEQLVLNRGGTSLTNSNLKLWYPMNDGHRGQQSYILDASNTGLGPNLLSNGDMEGSGGWQASNTAHGGSDNIATGTVIPDDGVGLVSDNQTLKYTTDKSYTGNRSMYLNTGISSSDGMRQSFAAVAGTTYKFSGWFWCADGSQAKFANENGTFQDNLSVKTSHGIDAEWQYLEMYATCEVDDATAYVYVWTDGSGENPFYCDDIKVQTVNDKNHATTVFYGDELVLGDDKDMDTVGNWVGAGGGSVTGGHNSGDAGHDKTLQIEAGTTDHDRAELSQSDLDEVLIAGRTYLVTFDYKFIDTTNMANDAYIVIGDTTKQNLDRTTLGTWTAYSDTFVASDSSTNIRIYCQGQSGHADNEMLLDNFSIKEIGIASGWTDADQQLDIPQTALQSYNQLAYFFSEDEDAVDSEVDCGEGGGDLDMGTSDFTLSGWVRKESMTGEYMMICNKGGANSPGYALGFETLGKIAANTSTTGNNVWTLYNDSSFIELGKWYHIVSTHDRSGNCKLYANGELLSGTNEDISATGDLDNGENFTIGNYYNPPGAGWQLNGCVTEVSVWKNVVMSADEVRELYNDGKALDATTHSQKTNLVGYWRDNGLSTWTDLSGNGNHGTPTNLTETMLITAGVDGSRDSQGFLMNRQRTTNSLNLANTSGMPDGTFSHAEIKSSGDDDLAFIGVGDAFSISLWVKTSHIASTSQFIISRNDNTDGYRMGIGSTNKLSFEVEENGNKNTAITDNAILADTWYHVVGTFDGDPSNDGSGVVKLYLNGVNGGSTTNDATSNDMDASSGRDGVFIGQHQVRNADEGFFGEIDDLCIYDKVLSQPEVTRNYNAGKRSHR